MKYVLFLHVLCTVCTLISICVFKISPLVEYILECNFTNFRHTDSYSDCGNKMFYYRKKRNSSLTSTVVLQCRNVTCHWIDSMSIKYISALGWSLNWSQVNIIQDKAAVHKVRRLYARFPLCIYHHMQLWKVKVAKTLLIIGSKCIAALTWLVILFSEVFFGWEQSCTDQTSSPKDWPHRTQGPRYNWR